MLAGGSGSLSAQGLPRRAVPVLVLAVVLALLAGSIAAAPLHAAKPKKDQVPAGAQAVIEAARGYVGRPYRLGTQGPDQFDCSGLVFRAFADAGRVSLIGGRRIRAAGYMRWFAERGQYTTDESLVRPGDLVMYDNGKHIGFYVGDGMVLSAILSGVTVHLLHGLTQDVTGFLRVDWNDDGAEGGSPIDLNTPIDLEPIDESEVPAELVAPSAWAPVPSEDDLAQSAPEGIERVDMRTAGSRTFEAPDGSFTTEVFSRSINYQPTDTTDWLPIDLRFEPTGRRGRQAMVVASPVEIVLSPVKRHANFAELSVGEQQLSLGVAGRRGATALAPVLGADGQYVDYQGVFGQNAGLRLFARGDGLKVFLVLTGRPAANRFDFTLAGSGLTPVAAADGSIELLAADGTAAGRIPPPLTMTSRDSQGNGGGVSLDAARLELGDGADPAIVSLVVDRGFLARPAYPLFVDLTIAGLGRATVPDEQAAGATFVLSSWPDGNFSAFQRPEWPAHPELWHGRLPGRDSYSETYLRFIDTADSLRGLAVDSAALRIFPYWQHDTDGSTSIDQPDGEWQPGTITWNNRPAGGEYLGPFATTPGEWADIDVTDYLAGVLAGDPDSGLRLHASDAGRQGWKRFVAAGTDATALEPRLVVHWSGLRPAPLVTSTAAPSDLVLAWTHADLAPEQARFEVEVFGGETDAALFGSGVVRGAVGRTSAWAVPTDELTVGESYSWRVRIRYGSKRAPWSEWSLPGSFVYQPAALDVAPIAHPGVGSDDPQPFGQEDGPEDREGQRGQ
ncbi:hypothetical protein BH23CHL7_BH23CHL7_07900 [soil metagenome]